MMKLCTPGPADRPRTREERMPHLVVRASVAAALVVALAPAASEAQYRPHRPGDQGSIRVLLGQFSPDCDSQYWDDKFLDFTGSASDFEDWAVQMDYRHPLGQGSALLLGMSWYEGATSQAYRDYVDSGGRSIAHRTSLATWDVSAAWIYEFGQRRSAVTPYLGAGVGYLLWELEEVGDFINFGDPDLPIFRAGYGSRDGTWEILAVVGLDIRLGHAVSLVAQARWRDADDELGGDFVGFGKLDLSGIDYALGFAYSF